MEAADRRALARKIGDSVTAPLPSRWPSTNTSSFVGRETAGDPSEGHLRTPRYRHRHRAGWSRQNPHGSTGGRHRRSLDGTTAASVDLVRVTDPAMVLPTIAASLGQILPRLGGSVRMLVKAALAESDAVIVLDNCEHCARRRTSMRCADAGGLPESGADRHEPCAVEGAIRVGLRGAWDVALG